MRATAPPPPAVGLWALGLLLAALLALGPPAAAQLGLSPGPSPSAAASPSSSPSAGASSTSSPSVGAEGGDGTTDFVVDSPDGGGVWSRDRGANPGAKDPALGADSGSEPGSLTLQREGSQRGAAPGGPQVNAGTASRLVPATDPLPKQVATGVAVALGVPLLAKVAATLFSRLRRDRLLDARVRGTIMEALEARPGLTIQDLAQVAGSSPGNVRYHLRVLRRNGLVRIVRVQGEEHFLPMTTAPTPVMREAALAANPRLRQVVDALAQGPLPASALVARLQAEGALPRSSAWHLLTQAERAHLVERHQDEGRLLVRLAAQAPLVVAAPAAAPLAGSGPA